VWTRGTWETKVSGKWVFHSSGVKSIAWSPSSTFVASGSYDQSIFLWNLNKPMKKQVCLHCLSSVVKIFLYFNSDVLHALSF